MDHLVVREGKHVVLGELQFETFSAASAEIIFQGRNVHPGTAKGQMINALHLAIDFHNQLMLFAYWLIELL